MVEVNESDYEFRDGRLWQVQPIVRQFEYTNDRDFRKVCKFAFQHVFESLVSKCGLKCVTIPKGKTPPGDPVSFVFASPELLQDRAEKLIVIIHGAGDVRAGVWTNRLLTQEHIDRGSQIPYVERAKKEGYAVLILNTNLDREENYEGGRKESHRELQDSEMIGDFRVEPTWLKMARSSRRIKCSESPELHADYVWRKFVASRKQLKRVAIVAHSYGGTVTMDLLRRHESDFRNLVFAICLSDAFAPFPKLDESINSHYKTICCNWVCQTKDAGFSKSDMTCQYAGTGEHIRAPYESMESIFSFISDRFKVSAKLQKLAVFPASAQSVSNDQQSLYSSDLLDCLPVASDLTEGDFSEEALMSLAPATAPVSSLLGMADEHAFGLPMIGRPSNESSYVFQTFAGFGGKACSRTSSSDASSKLHEAPIEESPDKNEQLFDDSSLEGLSIDSNKLSGSYMTGDTATLIDDDSLRGDVDDVQEASCSVGRYGSMLSKATRMRDNKGSQGAPTEVRIQNFDRFQSVDTSNSVLFEGEEGLTWTTNY